MKAEIASIPYTAGAWLGADTDVDAVKKLTYGSRIVVDHRNRWVILTEDEFTIRYHKSKYPELKLQSFGDSLFAPDV